MTDSAYTPIPVQTAKQICEQFAKSIAIVAAWDSVHGLIHITTYGVSAEAKVQAAAGGELVNKALGGFRELATHYEDFRNDFDAAAFKEALELLDLIYQRQASTPWFLQRIEKLKQARGTAPRSGGSA